VLGAAAEPERIDKVLSGLELGVSRTTLRRWIEEGRVTIDGSRCRPRDRAGAGQVIELSPGPPLPTRVEPDPTVAFDVVYEDAHLIVVNKPAGLVVHPGRGHWTRTLVAGLLARPGFERAPSDPRDPEGFMRPGIVHRIDRHTSGLLVVAKDDPTREGLKEQLASHTVERRYRAITLGVPEVSRIESLHTRHPRSRVRFTSLTETGRRAVTHVSVAERLAAGSCAVIECRLETGRTHQIRVHLSERAHTPLFADALYGGMPSADPLRAIARGLGRQALHAETLGFRHPITGEGLRFSAEMPDDLAGALAALRGRS
jgi:23S rRNA pseudouridine1911/1915/1917 synthase